MHKDRDFYLYVGIINFDKYVRKYIACEIPAVHRDLKIHLLDECYNLKKELVGAQYNKGNIRLKYITEMLITISMLDIIFSDIMDVIPKGKKSVITGIDNLTKIKNMTYAWRKNPEPNGETK